MTEYEWGPYEDVGVDYTITSNAIWPGTQALVGSADWELDDHEETGPPSSAATMNLVLAFGTQHTGLADAGSASWMTARTDAHEGGRPEWGSPFHVYRLFVGRAGGRAFNADYARGHWAGAVPPWPANAVDAEAETPYGELLGGSMTLTPKYFNLGGVPADPDFPPRAIVRAFPGASATFLNVNTFETLTAIGAELTSWPPGPLGTDWRTDWTTGATEEYTLDALMDPDTGAFALLTHIDWEPVAYSGATGDSVSVIWEVYVTVSYVCHPPRIRYLYVVPEEPEPPVESLITGALESNRARFM